MSEQATLVAIIAALYLSECIVWLRHGSVLIRFQGLRRCAVVHPSAAFGNERGGIVLLNPMPPFGSYFVCHQWPLTVTREIVCSYVAQAINIKRRPPQDTVLVRIDHVCDVRHESSSIFIGGAHFMALADEGQATRWAVFVRTLAGLPADGQDAAIGDAMRTALDVQRARLVLDRYRRGTAVLRPLC